jgi:hypothetical protein
MMIHQDSESHHIILLEVTMQLRNAAIMFASGKISIQRFHSQSYGTVI